MMNCKRGDVVLLEVIFSERIKTKKRPALIISSDTYHTARQEVIIAAITSNIKRVLPSDTMIEGWQKAGLNYPSLVTGIVQTVKANMIISKLGSLPSQDFQNVEKNLREAMGF